MLVHTRIHTASHKLCNFNNMGSIHRLQLVDGVLMQDQIDETCMMPMVWPCVDAPDSDVRLLFIEHVSL